MSYQNPKIILFNDTGLSHHVGCKAVSDSHNRMFREENIEVTYRYYVNELKELWKGNIDDTRRAIFDSDLINKIKNVDAVVVNGEGTIHHGAGLHLLGIISAAQELGKKTYLINSLFQVSEYYLDSLKKLNDFTVREKNSSEYLDSLGIKHRIVLDSILEAKFSDTPTIDLSGKIVVTDFHFQRQNDVGNALQKLLSEIGKDAVYYPIYDKQRNVDWQNCLANWKPAKLVVTGRYHGIYLAALAGLPFIALPSNSWKIEGLLKMFNNRIKEETDFSNLIKRIGELEGQKNLFTEFREFLNSHLPLKTLEVFKEDFNMSRGESLQSQKLSLLKTKSMRNKLEKQSLTINNSESADEIFTNPEGETVYAEDILSSCPEPICVVGNAVINDKLGDIIDSFATVIRLNNFVIEGFEECVGNKTDIRCVNTWNDLENRNEHLEICPFHISLPEAANYPNYLKKNVIPVYFAKSNIHNFIDEIPNPSTGFALIQLLVNLGKEITLFGFDGFKTNHYWDPDFSLNTTHKIGEIDYILLRKNVNLFQPNFAKVKSSNIPESKGNFELIKSEIISHTSKFKKSFIGAFNSFQKAQEEFTKQKFEKASKQIDDYKKQIDYSKFPIIDNRPRRKTAVSIIIVAYSTRRMLIDLIRLLNRQTEQDFEIIIVDNGGNDDVLEELLDFKICYVRCPINLILSEGRNIGASFSKSDILVFLDDDALVPENYVSEIKHAFKYFNITGLRGKVLPKTASINNKFANHYDLGKYSLPASVDTEGNSAFRKNEYLKVGGMDPLLFGGEGTDLSFRLSKLTGENSIIYYPKVIIYHDYADNSKKLKTKEDRHTLMKKYMTFKFPDIYEYHHRQKKYCLTDLTRAIGNSAIKRYKINGEIFFTIGIINYNSGKFLKDSLESALNQSYQNFEVIILDDGSNDNSIDIINSFLNYKNIKLITNAHSGAPSARNMVIENAKGDFVVWLDSDDILLQDTLEKYYKVIKQNPVCEVIYGNLIVTNENLQPENQMTFNNWFGKNYQMLGQIFKHNLVPNGGTAIKKTLFSKFGTYDTNFKRAHDYEFWTRLVGNANFVHQNSFVYLYRWHDNNLSVRKAKPDRSYEATIIIKLLKEYPIDLLFAEIFENSIDRKKSESIAYYLIAKKFFEYDSFENCITYCKKSINIIAYKESLELLTDAELKTTNYTIQSNLSKVNPFFTIGIITYNREQYISKAIDSALKQKGNFEVVIVDDGSTDNTENIVKGYQSDRIKYFKKTHTNAPDSRNWIIKKSNGKYIIWLDSDDEMLPGLIEEYSRVLIENPDADIIYCNNIRLIDESGEQFNINYRSFNGNIDPSEFLQGPPIPNVGTLVKKELYERVGNYNTEFIRAHDFEFWVRALESAKFFHCNKSLMFHRIHKNGNLSPISYKDTDTSFEIRILDLILSKYPAEKLFKEIKWNELSQEDRNKLDAQINFLFAAAYNKWKCYEKAVKYAQKSMKINCTNEVETFLQDLQPATNQENLKITALISSYNEGDIIYHVIKNLIDQNIDVYLIDHHSTDNTVEVASKFLGKGLLKIETFPEESGYKIDKDVYAWRFILERKEKIAKQLGMGWYIHADADEFRESPWIQHNLREAIIRVDSEGYNAINFNIYDFKPTNNDFVNGADVRMYLKFYSKPVLNFDNVQVKCWKYFGQEFDLRKSGGHLVEFKERRIYPIPFILRHYPIRSQKHGEKKVFNERKKRFDTIEKKSQWHAQYDHIKDRSFNFLHREEDLIEYDRQAVCSDIQKQFATCKNYESPLLSILLITFNQYDYTKMCINSISEKARINHELIIVDNASTDETVKNIKSNFPEIRLIENRTNNGFPTAVNQGIASSLGKYVLLLNNDTIITEGLIERLIEVAESDPKIGIVGPISNEVSGLQKDKNAKYNSIDEMHLYAASVREMNGNKITQFPRVAFLCTLIKREVINIIGGLDERFSPGNFEDDDFCLRAQLAGFKTVIANDVFIHHYGSKSFKADGERKYAERLKINHKIFVDKWGADPDEIWLKGKPFNQQRSLFISIDNDEFIKFFERAQKNIEDKEYVFAFTQLKKAYSEFENSNKSISIISKEELLLLTANIALIINELDDAKEYFEETLKLNPTSSEACFGLGQVFYQTEMFEQSKTMLEWAIKNDPENQKAAEGLRAVNEILSLPAEHNSLIVNELVITS